MAMRVLAHGSVYQVNSPPGEEERELVKWQPTPLKRLLARSLSVSRGVSSLVDSGRRPMDIHNSIEIRICIYKERERCYKRHSNCCACCVSTYALSTLVYTFCDVCV